LILTLGYVRIKYIYHWLSVTSGRGKSGAGRQTRCDLVPIEELGDSVGSLKKLFSLGRGPPSRLPLSNLCYVCYHKMYIIFICFYYVYKIVNMFLPFKGKMSSAIWDKDSRTWSRKRAKTAANRRTSKSNRHKHIFKNPKGWHLVFILYEGRLVDDSNIFVVVNYEMELFHYFVHSI